MLKKSLNKSSNPFFAGNRIAAAQTANADYSQAAESQEVMTVQGAVNKSIMLGVLLVATALVSFNFPNPLLIWGGLIGGLILVFVAVFKPQHSGKIAPAYAVLQGLVVGGISALYGAMYDGIIFQAISLTMAVFFIMLFIYKTGIIKVTQKFRAGVVMATGAILVVYVINFVMNLFGSGLPYLHEGGTVGILISLVIVGVAALNLLLDFDNFDKGEEAKAPIHMEWFAAMGLIITLVWLYLEILRLLAMLYGRD